MDPGTTLGSVFAAFGLAGAAGANAWLPLFASALLARLDVVEMGPPFDQLQTNVGLTVLGVCLVADFVGDKVPVLDSVLHTAGAAIAPVAGAVLFTGEAGTETDIPTVLSAVAGGGVAGAVHAVRALLRPVSTVATGGLANPVLSGIEDVASLSLTVVAFLAPFLAVLGIVALLVAGLVVWQRRRRRPARTG